LRVKSGRLSGGQLEHKGHTLKMESNPDSIIEHQPYFCTHCGNDLSLVEGSVIETRQVVDVHMPVAPLVTEHRMIEKKCTCGHCSQLDFPKVVRSRVSYGPNLRAIVVYLSCVLSIPYKRLTEILFNWYGVSLSQGTIDNILKDANAKSLDAYNEIRDRIEESNNNASERAVRNIKVKQKVSGMFKSDAGANIYCQIQSITQTAKKNNINPFLAILAVANNY
jgi:transposase